jgi:capsid protein
VEPADLACGCCQASRSRHPTQPQRQELVEQWVNYACLTDEFVGQFVRPVYEAFVNAAMVSGAIPVPTDVVPDSANDAMFVGTQMPWVDPMREASAWLELVEAGFASEVEVMRARGVNPDDTLEQIATFREKAKAKGLILKSDFANAQQGGAPGAAAAGGK